MSKVSWEKLLKFLKKYRQILGSQCLKITEKVSFKLSYILSGQSSLKMPKLVNIFQKLKLTVKQYYRSILIGQKLVKNANVGKLKCYILDDFQTLFRILFYSYNTLFKIFIFCPITDFCTKIWLFDIVCSNWQCFF